MSEKYKVPESKKIRVIIDTDAACEADDQYAIVHALMTQKFIKETWKFAHMYFGKLWFICRLILLLPSVVVMLFVLGKDVNTVGSVGAIIVFVQMIPMFGTIIPTEKALKKNFDEYGTHR